MKESAVEDLVLEEELFALVSDVIGRGFRVMSCVKEGRECIGFA